MEGGDAIGHLEEILMRPAVARCKIPDCPAHLSEHSRLRIVRLHCSVCVCASAAGDQALCAQTHEESSEHRLPRPGHGGAKPNRDQ